MIDDKYRVRCARASSKDYLIIIIKSDGDYIGSPIESPEAKIFTFIRAAILRGSTVTFALPLILTAIAATLTIV